MTASSFAAGQRLRRAGATSNAAIKRRILSLGIERNIPPEELRAALAGVRRVPTLALSDFAERHEINYDWLVTGSLRGLREMARPQPEPSLEELREALRQTPPRERAVLYRSIRARAARSADDPRRA